MKSLKEIFISLSNSSIYIGLIIVIAIFLYLLLAVHYLVAVAFSILPLVLVFAYLILKNPYYPLMVFFIACYFIMGIARYIPIPSIGLSADGLLILTLVALTIYSLMNKYSWKDGLNEYTAVTFIWLTYCILELLNPYASFQAWSTSIRFMAIYAFLISVLVPLIFNRYKDLKRILFLWSIFTLLAVIKAWCQKNIGFDAAENYWLFVLGKASTHIIGSGVRYFSFYTDAANFGSGMGLAMVTFTIMGIHMKSVKWKTYFLLVGLAAGYGLMISGTRSAMIIPFMGFPFYILFSKNWRSVIFGGVVVILALIFFVMTNIGQGNAQIRRMRSAFKAEQDASYNLRKENQKRIKAYMVGKPFGVGVGMGGGKASSNASDSFSTQIATDSWMVVLWMETGVVGLSLYIALFLFLQLRGAYIVFFKISNEQLKYLLGAILSGIFGIMVSSYSNEVISQFPNGIIIFVGYAFVFSAQKLERTITQKELW